jgi:hypothetical protein
MRTPLLFSLMLVLGLAGAPLLLWASQGSGRGSFRVGLILGHLAHELVHSPIAPGREYQPQRMAG